MSLISIAASAFFSILVIFCAAPRMISFFGVLSAPVIAFQRERKSLLKFSRNDLRRLTRGLFRLWSIYFMISFIFALAGAAIAAFPPLSDFVPGRVGIIYGLLLGILLCNIARVVSVNFSSFIVKYLIMLMLVAVGILVIVLFLDPDLLTIISDVHLKRVLFTLPVYILISTSVACLLTEGLIHLGHYIGRQRSRMIPYSLVMERMEDYETVEQVFVAHSVRQRTDSVIREVINREGPIDVCWLTNTAPEDHITELFEATLQWAKCKYPDKNEEQHKRLTNELLCKGIRIIARDEMIEDIRKQMPCLEKFGQLQSPVRTRLLILNNAKAIVHLPIPFTGDPDEESNFAAIVDDPERVQQLKSVFNSFWESTSDKEYGEHEIG